MNGPDHYAEAERLLALAEKEMGGYAATRDPQSEAYHLAQGTWAQQRAQVHATLALAAATVEAADQQIDTNYRRPLVMRPTNGDDVDPPFPGSPWGRALYGELQSREEATS